MSKDHIQKCAFILLICVLLPITAIPVFAQSGTEPDLSKKGSLYVSLCDGDTALSSAEITLYQIAQLIKKDSVYEYSFVDSFIQCGMTTDDFGDDKTAQKLSDYAVKNNIAGKSLKTDADGCVRFDDLQLGIYLAVQTGSVEGFLNCPPFLVTIPLNENGKFIYIVDATPKTEIVRLVDITVQKIWNDNGMQRPESVTVQLMKGENVFDTVDLNEKNGWSHQWQSLPSSDLWSVKEVNIPKDYTPTYKQNGFNFTVINSGTLIKTGQTNWPVPVFSGIGLFLFAIGWIMVYLKDEKKA